MRAEREGGEEVSPSSRIIKLGYYGVSFVGVVELRDARSGSYAKYRKRWVRTFTVGLRIVAELCRRSTSVWRARERATTTVLTTRVRLD